MAYVLKRVWEDEPELPDRIRLIVEGDPVAVREALYLVQRSNRKVSCLVTDCSNPVKDKVLREATPLNPDRPDDDEGPSWFD